MLAALVTGASRGVGKGVAASLALAGYRVYATGRTVADSDLAADIAKVPCDHLDSARTAAAFAQVAEPLEILVNSAWGGYERMVEDNRFTWDFPFGSSPPTAGRR